MVKPVNDFRLEKKTNFNIHFKEYYDMPNDMIYMVWRDYSCMYSKIFTSNNFCQINFYYFCASVNWFFYF